MSDVAEKVKAIVVEHLGVEADKVSDTASFIDDLGADSLDNVELVMAFEEEFGSGFVEPSSCHDCSIHELKRKGDQSADCYGCNRRVLLDKLVESGSGLEPEQLIREVTSAVAQRLER